MGRKKNRQSNRSCNEESDSVAAHGITEDVIDDLPKLHHLDGYLEDLFHKRGPKREHALMMMIEWLRFKLEHEYVEKKCATLLYHFLISIKKGSFKEIEFATNAIALLSIIISSEDKSHEIYEESIPLLKEVLKSKSQSPMIFLCVALVTLFGSNNVNETESTMKYLWEFIDSKSGSNSGARKYSYPIVAAAVSGWSLLLSSIDQWKLSHRYWQGAISSFLNLLEVNDEAVCVAAGEALALIFEMGSIKKFSSKCDAEGSTSADEPSNYAIHEKSVKDSVLKKLEQVSDELNFVEAFNGDWNVIQFLKDGICPEVKVKIRKQYLTLSSWSRIVQLKSFISLLGVPAFGEHMLGNELLQDYFEFKPVIKSFSDTELYEPTVDEVCVRFYCHPKSGDMTKLTREQRKSIRNNMLSTMEKAKTILLKKHRQQAKMRDNDNIFGC